MTTPNQRAPEGAFTVGGGEFRFGQTVDESVITDLFEVQIPSKADLQNVGVRDILTGDYDVASNYLGRALGNIPFESLKQFERFVLDPTEEDPATEFVDQEDGINRILESFGLKSASGDDIWARFLDWLHRFFPGGDPDGAGDAIKDFFDKVQENLETLNEMTAPGNKVISPNFELPSIIREPYGAPTWAYTTPAEGVKRMGFRSLKFTTTAAAEQGMFLSPSQRRKDFIVRPGLYSDSGLNIKAHASNGTAGSVSLKFRWYDGDTFLSEDSTTVLNSNPLLKSSWFDLELEAMAPDHCDRLEMFVVASADSAVGNTYYLDAAFLRDKTRLQKVIEDMLAALNGEAGSGTLFDRIKALKEKADETQATVEGMNSPGNRFLSPNLEFTFIKRFPYGTPAPTVEYSTEQSVLGSKSLKWITTSAADQGVFFNPTQQTAQFNCQPGTVFDCFCKVRGYSGNSTGTTSIVMRWKNYSGTVLHTTVGTVKNNSDSTFKSSWVDFEVMDEAPHDATFLEVYLVSSAATAIGSRFYVDAVAVQEKTAVQKVVDKIHEAIDGATAARNERVDTVKDKMQQAWGKIVDGLKGLPSGTTYAAIAQDMYDAAAEVNSTAETALTNADVAQTTADDAVTQVTEAQTLAELAASLAEMRSTFNLVTSPRFESTKIPLLTNEGTETGADAQMTYSTDYVHTTGRSVKTIGTRNVYPLISTYGSPWDTDLWAYGSVECVPGDVFYAEAYIYNPNAINFSTTGGYCTIEALKDGNTTPTSLLDSSFGTFGGLNVVDVQTLADDAWTKLWGYFTVPSGWNKIGFRLVSYPVVPGLEIPNTYYWGDPLLMRGESKTALEAAEVAFTEAESAAATAATAETAAGAAVTVADDAATSTQEVVDGISQSVFDNGVTDLPTTTVKQRLQKAWASIYDGLNGTTGTAAKVPNDVAVAAAAVKSVASSADSAASSAHTRVDGTNTALFGGTSAASAILAAAVPNISAAKITSGTIATSVLPVGVGAVGSGFIMRNTTDSFSVSCSANTPTAIKFTTAFYDSAASGTSDYTLSTGGSGELKVTASNAGWYMVEVAFGIAQTARAVGYRISAALFLNGNIHKSGSTVDYFGSASAQIPFCAQGAFIVYLSPGNYVTPGCVLYSQSTIASGSSGANLISPNYNEDTYFSVSLLNKSLA